MTGEMNINKLLAGMSPVLDEVEYAFVTRESADRKFDQSCLMTFKEDEGYTYIVPWATAQDEQLLRYCRITLSIHSALEAVGFLAAISAELTKHNISSNCVSAYFHDHLFIAESDAQKAMDVLNGLALANRQ